MKTTICLGLLLAALLPAQQEPLIRAGETFRYAAIEGKGSYGQIPAAMAALTQALQQQKVAPAGTPIGIYYNSPAQVAEAELRWEVAMPIDDAQTVQPPLLKKTFSCAQAAELVHRGPYETTAQSIGRLMQFIAASGYYPAGPVVETYLDDPATVKAADLRTIITVPVAKR